MKRCADVVIIGGGIIGCTAAYFLSKYTRDVVLLERKGIASEASGANYGMIWEQTRQPGYDLTMARRSLELYPTLINEVFDTDIEYEKKGGMTVFFTELERTAAEIVTRSKQSQGIPLQLLGAPEVRELEPALSEEIMGAVYCHEDAQLNPMLTTIAFARAARKGGVAIYTDTEVLSIRTHNQSVQSVITNRGEIKTSIVLNAAGSWASQIGDMVGLKIPVYPHKLQSFVTEQIPHVLNRVIQGTQIHRDSSLEEAVQGFSYTRNVSAERPRIGQQPFHQGALADNTMLYIKPTVSDNIVCGTTFEFVGHDKNTSYESLTLIAANAKKTLPQLKDVHIIRSWANFDPWTVDGIPIVGETEIGGFIIAAGHGTAMSHGPATAEALAELIVHGKPIPFGEQASITRFTD
ncbi:MAG: FAD-binding oxidoreductase [Dehalococcoidia bacterium]|nr:FAD-binding oxidoreductase [Dehalococcoidia bacterium]